jgi:replicative DNA helicase
MICAFCNINSIDLNNGKLSHQEETDYYKAADRIKNLPIRIIDKPNMSVSKIRRKVRQLNKKGLCDIVFIDYLQLVETSGKKQQSTREVDVSDISRGLKGLAKEVNIPIIALSQLSRKCEDRTDKRPLLSDLRESGGIEADADFITLLMRPAYYGIKLYNDLDTEGLMSYNVAKFRHGACGETLLKHNIQFTRFKELSEPAETYFTPDVNKNIEPQKQEDIPF